MKLTISILFVCTSNLTFSQSITLGLVADCQYCECPYSQTWDNDYSKSPNRLQEATDTFNALPVDVSFHLGDFIDRDFSNFNKVSAIFNKLHMPHYHLLGNHDFSIHDTLKPEVYAVLNLKQPYYFMDIHNWRIIALDGTDISSYASTDITQIAYADSLMNHYAQEGRLQAKPWNGAIGNEQMKWLDDLLKNADSMIKSVLILCHFPVYPENAANLWNDSELIDIIEKYTCVKAYINGHHHPGNYALKNGVHYLTLQGMVKSKTQNSFSIGSLRTNEIIIFGFGREPHRTLKF
jgi:calcineurin-like phosphoesterase family protein